MLIQPAIPPQLAAAAGQMTEQDAVFVEALGWFPWYFIVSFILVVFLHRLRFAKKPA